MTESGSLLDVNIDDAQEFRTHPDGSEVELRIDYAEVSENRNDPTRYNLALVLVDPADPTIDDIRIWLPIPNKKMKEEDERRYRKQVNRMKSFYECFGIEASGPIDVNDIIGLTGYCILGESEDPQYGMQNFVRQFVPRRN